jgi:phytoene dehydrogenase-like protein
MAAIAMGGTQAITNALVSAGKKHGVEYHINSEVQKLLSKSKREPAGRRGRAIPDPAF